MGVVVLATGVAASPSRESVHAVSLIFKFPTLQNLRHAASVEWVASAAELVQGPPCESRRNRLENSPHDERRDLKARAYPKVPTLVATIVLLQVACDNRRCAEMETASADVVARDATVSVAVDAADDGASPALVAPTFPAETTCRVERVRAVLAGTKDFNALRVLAVMPIATEMPNIGLTATDGKDFKPLTGTESTLFNFWCELEEGKCHEYTMLSLSRFARTGKLGVGDFTMPSVPPRIKARTQSVIVIANNFQTWTVDLLRHKLRYESHLDVPEMPAASSRSHAEIDCGP